MNFKGLVIDHCHTVQLKGNLIPARVLQVEYCQVKIIKGGPIPLFCDTFNTKYRAENFTDTDSDTNTPHQANCWACAPTNVTLILNELFIILVVYIAT